MVGRGSKTVDRYSQSTDHLLPHRLQVQIARRAGASAVQPSKPIVVVDSFSHLVPTARQFSGPAQIRNRVRRVLCK